MSKVKEIFLEEQQRAATRSNPEFQNHVRMLKEEPNPVEVQQSSLNSFNSMMEDFGLSPYRQTLLRGLMMNYAECERLIAIGYTPNTLNSKSA